MNNVRVLLTTFLMSILVPLTSFGSSPLPALPGMDRLEQVVSELAREWNDNNISGGTTLASTAKIASVPTTKDEWKAFAVAIFSEKFKKETGQSVPADTYLRVSAAKFGAASVDAAVKAVAESNDYNTQNEELMASLKVQTLTLVDALGDPKDLFFVAVKARMDDEISGERRTVRITAFVNVKTAKIVSIFTVEGSM